MVEDGAFSHNRDYFTIHNLEEYSNRFTDSKVEGILLNGWILSMGGASGVEGLQSRGLPRLV